MGFDGGEIENGYGEGIGQTWLDDMGCTGREKTLSECNHPQWGQENCGHSEDAGVNCGKYKDWIVCTIGCRHNNNDDYRIAMLIPID